MALTPRIRSIIMDLFVRTADENYITARWCIENGLHVDFYWLSAHSVEKYCKAILLFNGYKAQSDGHNIVELFKKVKTIAEDLIPSKISKPDHLDVHNWMEMKTDDFIRKLYRNGNPDNRYLLYGYASDKTDVFRLDATVFYLRRCVCSLDEPLFGQREISEGAPKLTEREVLLKQKLFYHSLNMPLDDVIKDKNTTQKKICCT